MYDIKFCSAALNLWFIESSDVCVVHIELWPFEVEATLFYIL